ncbi:hypothetical protein P692DRAFT_20518084 [Suillus brevipes Sb2]|nr:hypothetical protein P692DRAFT_20518084 [Suillus brevipes Sb2]
MSKPPLCPIQSSIYVLPCHTWSLFSFRPCNEGFPNLMSLECHDRLQYEPVSGIVLHDQPLCRSRRAFHLVVHSVSSLTVVRVIAVVKYNAIVVVVYVAAHFSFLSYLLVI